MIEFFVPGFARPQGSKRSMPVYAGSVKKGTRHKTGESVMVESSKVKPWRAAVQFAANEARGGTPLMDGPVSVAADFIFPRPRKHFRAKDGAIKPGVPWHVANRTAGDVDKLLRAIFDAMTTIVFHDDSQVVEVRARKVYAIGHEQPGVRISVKAME